MVWHRGVRRRPPCFAGAGVGGRGAESKIYAVRRSAVTNQNLARSSLSAATTAIPAIHIQIVALRGRGHRDLTRADGAVQASSEGRGNS